MSDAIQPPVIQQSQMTTPQSGLATASLVCGILALLTCVTGIPAIITGHLALSRINAARGLIGGRGAAKAGLALGYGAIGLYLMIMMVAMVAGMAAPLIIRQREKAGLTECMGKMQQIGSGLTEYQTRHAATGPAFPPDLRQLGTEGITTNIEQLLAISKRGDKWIYFPGADPKDFSAPLLVSPRFGSHAAVLKVDGSVQRLPSSSVATLLTKQASAPVNIPVPGK